MRNSGFQYFLLFFIVLACNDDSGVQPPGISMQITAIRVGTNDLLTNPDDPQPIDQVIIISFSHALDTTMVPANVKLLNASQQEVNLGFSFLDNFKTISAKPLNELANNSSYTLNILNEIKGVAGEEFAGFSLSFQTINPPLELLEITIDQNEVDLTSRITDVKRTPSIQLGFSHDVDLVDLMDNLFFNAGNIAPIFNVDELSDSKNFEITFAEQLEGYQRYSGGISKALSSTNGNDFEGFEFSFYTELDSTVKFPEISEDELLTLVQQQTFKYFWDFGHPVSGLARERNTSGETVTSGARVLV